MRRALKYFGVLLLFGVGFLLPQSLAHSEFTGYKSPNTVYTFGNPSFTNLENCKKTDSITCDRPLDNSSATLLFTDFDDFDIPLGSKVNFVHIKITGKSTHLMHAGVSASRSTLTGTCQASSWVPWSAYSIVSAYITTFNASSLYVVPLSYCLSEEKLKNKTYSFFVRASYGSNWTANIDNFEVGFDYDPPPEIGPEPFLDLPWDYDSTSNSFDFASTNINAYFDHEYPLLSTNLSEPNEALNSIISFKNHERSTQDYYSGHDGFDWGSDAGIKYGTPVLAAADGVARYIPQADCNACGKQIRIDHPNGYQTRYYHLQSDGLVTTDESTPVSVSKGQQIGLVGLTGNTTGPHIHFMVIQDKNNDDVFEDNIPDGLTDPFGWNLSQPDPWENYNFSYKGEERTGNKSYYLWSNNLSKTTKSINPSTDESISLSDFLVLNIHAESSSAQLNFQIESTAVTTPDLLRLLTTAVKITAEDSLGNLITNFDKLLGVTFNINSIDLENINPDSISIYSSPDGKTWTKESTTIDLNEGTATTHINHLSYFALFGEKIDTQPPATNINIIGQNSQDNKYFPNVQIVLSPSDEKSDIEYTSYSINNGEWTLYTQPLSFTGIGDYKIDFHSGDIYGNTEEIKSERFEIVEIPAELSVSYDTESKKFIYKPLFAPDSSSINIDYDGSELNIELNNLSENSLEASALIKDLKFREEFSFDKLIYNGTEVFELEINKLAVIAKFDKDDNLSQLKQEFFVGEIKQIMIDYERKTNNSRIIEFTPIGPKYITKNGVVILTTYTDKGVIKYKY